MSVTDSNSDPDDSTDSNTDTGPDPGHARLAITDTDDGTITIAEVGNETSAWLTIDEEELIDISWMN